MHCLHWVKVKSLLTGIKALNVTENAEMKLNNVNQVHEKQRKIIILQSTSMIPCIAIGYYMIRWAIEFAYQVCKAPTSWWKSHEFDNLNII